MITLRGHLALSLLSFLASAMFYPFEVPLATPLATKLRQTLTILIVILLNVMAARIVVHDFEGSLVIFWIVVIGANAVRESASTMLVILFAFALCTGACLDISVFLQRFVISTGHMFSKSLPIYMNICHGICALGPFLELWGAIAAFRLYFELELRSDAGTDVFES